MRHHIRSNLVAYVALFFALGGGTASAVTALAGPNTVNSAAIVNGQVKRADVGANAINSAKVANGTLKRADFARGTLLSPAGPQGPKGDPGERGPQGDKGDRGEKGERGVAGAAGVTGYHTRETSTGFTTAKSITATASCNTGSKALGGGFWLSSNTGAIPRLDASKPNTARTGWEVRLFNPNGINANILTFVTCAEVR